ncbi:MAG TPA: hypothetical protein VI911_09790 [Patescibacteria group bacterium]|nr:hypothetical protein [Patescibacteria group bacterium]
MSRLIPGDIGAWMSCEGTLYESESTDGELVWLKANRLGRIRIGKGDEPYDWFYLGQDMEKATEVFNKLLAGEKVGRIDESE